MTNVLHNDNGNEYPMTCAQMVSLLAPNLKGGIEQWGQRDLCTKFVENIKKQSVTNYEACSDALRGNTHKSLITLLDTNKSLKTDDQWNFLQVEPIIYPLAIMIFENLFANIIGGIQILDKATDKIFFMDQFDKDTDFIHNRLMSMHVASHNNIIPWEFKKYSNLSTYINTTSLKIKLMPLVKEITGEFNKNTLYSMLNSNNICTKMFSLTDTIYKASKEITDITGNMANILVLSSTDAFKLGFSNISEDNSLDYPEAKYLGVWNKFKVYHHSFEEIGSLVIRKGSIWNEVALILAINTMSLNPDNINIKSTTQVVNENYFRVI